MTGGAGVTPDNLPAFAAALARRGFPMGYRAQGGDPAQWRDRALDLARGLILPDLPAAPPALEWLAEQDRGDHLAQRVAITLTDGLRLPVLMLRPKGPGPFPAVLALHDHGSRFDIGKEKCIPWDAGQADDWTLRHFGGQAIGPELARRGYIVLAADALGWGEREGQGYAAQQALAANLMNLGVTLAGLIAWEDARLADVLAGWPGVDPARVAAVGYSMGGFRAWQVAALSPVIAASVTACWMASLPGLMVPGNNHTRGQSAFCMTHPLLARHMDLPDLAALAAPKPMLVQTGTDDPLFPPGAVDPAFDMLHEVWRAWGCGDALETQRWPGGHGFGPDRQSAAFDWLDRHLRPAKILR